VATLEKRITDLEAKAASTEKSVRVYFCNEGEDEAQARLGAGIPPDYPGKVVCVQFVESPNALKE
jgi:hypothetical protein